MRRFLPVLLLALAACGGGGPTSERIAGQPVAVFIGKPSRPLVLVLHGYGSDERSLTDKRHRSAVTRLRDNGFTVAASRAHGDAWGSAASVADYRAAVEQVQREARSSGVVVIAESMGALAGAQLADLPGLRLWIGVSPVIDAPGLAAASAYYRQQMVAARGTVPPAAAVRTTVPVAVVVDEHDAVVPARLSVVAGARVAHCTGGHVSADCWDTAVDLLLHLTPPD